MKKIVLLFVVVLSATFVYAQSYKETFDTNSLEWTECGYKNGLGTAIIDKGTMTIKSKGELKGLGAIASGLSGVNTKVRENTFFETHCYAPIDVEKPFTVVAKVNVKKLEDDRLVGFVFNYRDGGNYYAFAFNGSFVKFIRYENNKVVGEVMQGLPDSGKRRADMQWTLASDGNQLIFKVDGAVALNIRYMPLQYAGFGFYTFGNQELIVDEVEFIQ